MPRRFNVIAIILLFIWISFFPCPIQQKYHLATKVFLGLAFVALLIRRRASLFKLGDFPLWLFLAAIGINVLFAQNKQMAFRTYLDLLIPMFLIFYVASDAFSSKSGFNFLAKTICICSILVALGGIIECLFAVNPIYEHFIENPYYRRYITGFVRPMSTQFNPAPLASYLLGCLPFNFLLFKQSKSFFRILGAIGIALNMVVIILTFSRGAFLGLIAIVALYLFAQRKHRSIGIILILLCILVSTYLPYPFIRFGIDWTMGKDGILSTYRLNRCIMTQRIIRDHPFVGLGFRHIRARFGEYYPGKYIPPYEVMIADNMHLTILGETGIIGFLGFSIFVFSLLKKGWGRLKILGHTSLRRWQLLIGLMAFMGLLVNMGAYELFYWPNQYMFFCILAGALGAFYRNREGAFRVGEVS